MTGGPRAANPDAYVEALTGWQLARVRALRAAVREAAALDEVLKWGHLVYFANGPVLLIRAEDDRVLFGFWRGQRLLDLEPRLKPGGKYEMATLELRVGTMISAAQARRLAKRAVSLNRTAGDPTRDALKERAPARRTGAGSSSSGRRARRAGR